MSEPRKLRCYEYVNRPYSRVSALLRTRGVEMFQRATRSAGARADALSSTLRVGGGAFEIGVDIRIHVRNAREEEGIAGMSPVTRLEIDWEAARAAALFPSMDAQLSAWPLSSDETQLEIEGEYRPPLGVFGNAMDALVGHRIAEAAVHRFLEDLTEQLREDAAAT